MKWMIASDLHGSAYYCKLLMQRWAEEQADTLIFLGDILYHGPRNDLPRDYAPKEVIAMLNPLADQAPLRPRQLRLRGRPDGAPVPDPRGTMPCWPSAGGAST